MAFGTLRDRGTENEKRAVDDMMERVNLMLSVSDSCRLVYLSDCIILASLSLANPLSST